VTDGYGNPLQDLAAEQATVGAMLLSRTVVSDVMEVVNAQDFGDPAHRILFAVIAELHGKGEPIDALMVSKALADSGDLLRVGGAPYLHTLIEAVPTVSNATHYARIVADYATLRNLDAVCVRIRQKIHSRTDSPADLVEEARVLVADLAGRAASTDGPVIWNDITEEGLDAANAREARRDAGEVGGIPTGLPDLDRVIHGLQPGQVYVIAGESGSGKSTLAGDLVRSSAFANDEPTLYFALEMSRVEMFNKLVCAQAGVLHDRLVEGTLDLDDWTAIGKVCGKTRDAPLFIDESGRLSVADMRVRALRIKRERGLKVIVVDLIGLAAPALNSAPREQQVADISRRLHALSKELQVAVVVVGPMKPNHHAPADKSPALHDLRESAQIGHDAAAVILVYRPEKADRKTQRVGEADLIIDKNRFGAETTLTVAAQLHYSRFVSMANA
jgi:replicative DNA helicase